MKTLFILIFGDFLAYHTPIVCGKSNTRATPADYALPEEVEHVNMFWHDFEALNQNNELVPNLNITYKEKLDDGAYRYGPKDLLYVARICSKNHKWDREA